jgi:threonine dehydrogenase-like Zn-dependent dehydrogenase
MLEEKYGKTLGGFGSGGFNEYFVGFEHQFTKVPEGLPDRVAVLAEPFAVALHAVARNLPEENDEVLVIGSGIIGLMVIAALKRLGSKARIITTAKYPFQKSAAESLGANIVVQTSSKTDYYKRIAESTNSSLTKPILGKNLVYDGKGVDIIYDTVGTDSTLDDAIRLVRNNGKIVIIGMGFGITKKTEWVLQVLKEIEIVGSMMHGYEQINDEKVDTMELALRIMMENPSPFMNLVTHEYRISDYKRAFSESMKKGVYKVV